MTDAVFAALGDATRRDLYGRLARRGPITATALAADLAITRQAVAKHLAVLADAGMARSERVGRETRFEAELDPLHDVQQWISAVESQWQQRLSALADSIQHPPDPS